MTVSGSGSGKLMVFIGEKGRFAGDWNSDCLKGEAPTASCRLDEPRSIGLIGTGHRFAGELNKETLDGELPDWVDSLIAGSPN